MKNLFLTYNKNKMFIRPDFFDLKFNKKVFGVL